MFVLVRDRIPKFGLSLMNKVDSWQFKVLCMPAKECFPTPDIAVGCVDAFDLVWESVSENRIESVEVPAFGRFIHERIEKICSVEGGGEGYVFPKLYYYYIYHFFDFVCCEIVGDSIELMSFLAKLCEAHRFTRNMQALINSSFSEGILLNWAVYN